MKSFFVIGLGRFGMALALRLREQGHEVLGMDIRQDRVQAVAEVLTQAVAGDARDPDVLREVGARNFDCAVVAFSADVGDSALITLNLKEQGVSRVVSKASSAVHRKVLEKIGADQVVFPEQEMALRLAHSLSNGDILNFIELSDEYSMVEQKVPQSWADRSIVELDIRVKYRLTVIAVRRGDSMTISPGRDFLFQTGDCMVVLGHNKDISGLEEL
ncbi:MAG: TrkA family potassium uptake protein [Oscillospiraceae bacterium]|nr:TrkA family potassium uptake protein [Oscillospiraceae bacterium]